MQNVVHSRFAAISGVLSISSMLVVLAGCASQGAHVHSDRCAHAHDAAQGDAAAMQQNELLSGATQCHLVSTEGMDPALLAWAEQQAAEVEVPYVACFDSEKPPSKEIMALVNQVMRRAQAEQYYTSGRWSGTTGTPRALTWSFVPDGTQVPGLNGGASSASTLFASMDTKFGAANRATWIAQFQACFDRWSAITGTSYTRITTGGTDWDDGAAFPTSGGNASRGDIRISMRVLDGTNGVLAFNYFPSTGDMVIDSSENWANATSSYRFLRNTLMHEHGHGLGINHVCSADSAQLMEPFLSTSFDGPQQDDLRASNSMYGDMLEPNNTTGSPTVLGALAAGGGALSPVSLPAPAIAEGSSTSIDVNGDIDYYRVSVTEPLLVDVTLTPLGTTYADNAQNVDGSCSTGITTDALAVADLAVDVRTGAGSVVLATAGAAAPGVVESLSAVLLSPAGDYLVRVTENGSPTESQMYSLSVSNPRRASITATDGTSSAQVALSWTNVPAAASYNIFRSATTIRADAVSIGSTTAGTTTFNDTTALPAVVYNYWVEAVQGGTVSRALAGPDSGFRTAPPTPPANDNCVNATPMLFATNVNGTTVNATSDGVTTCGPASLRDVYFSFVAPCNSPIRITTDLPATNADTVLSVHSLCQASVLNTVACNDDIGGGNLQSEVTFPATAGSTYRVRVATKGAAGLTFQLRAEVLPACNDIDFNNDGLFPDDTDLIDFLAVLSGAACTTGSCDSIDFNNDGLFPDDNDLLIFLTVLSGGECPCS